MADIKTANYTDEMVEKAVSMYSELGNEGLDAIAETVGKTVRSVRSKLVREGVYVASPKAAAAKSTGPSKKEMLQQLEGIAPFEVSGFMGATKGAIGILIDHFDQD